MSYIRSTLRCEGCGHEMNVAFGIVGMTIIAAHPKCCPACGSEDLAHITDGWRAYGKPDPLDLAEDTGTQEP